MPARYIHTCLIASSRQRNEDRVLVLERGSDVVVIVADGAGGMNGGGAASDAVLSAVTAAVHDSSFDLHSADSWETLLRELDNRLARAMTGETTAVVVAVGAHGLIGASVGDSQAWVIGEELLYNLTANQNKKRAGSGHAVPVSFFHPPLAGTLVVGTDGLWHYTSMEKVAEVVRRCGPADAPEELRALVQLPSGMYADDVGIVVVAPA
jgi:serine/threonine protein phosphatase PrpC